jgi:hypothetical protein
MGLFINLSGVIRKDSESNRNRVNQQSEALISIIRDSIETARVTPNLEMKKASLDFAMKKVIDLIALANRHPFIASKKLSSIYVSIREVRNEIKSIESETVPYSKLEVA